MNALSATIRSQPLPFALGALGTFVAVALLFVSTGTNDVHAWERYAAAVGQDGLAALYEQDRRFNHPPLMGWLSWSCLAFANATGLSFPAVFRAVPVAANVGTGLVLFALWRAREGERRGAWVFAAWSLSLPPLLVGAYHGNTDCLCIFLCLLAAWLLEARRRPAAAGLALAAAINVKIIPVLFALPLWAACRSLGEARRFAAGLAAAVVPFALVLPNAGDALVRNVFRYASSLELWGVQVWIRMFQTFPGLGAEGHTALVHGYVAAGRFVLGAALVALAVWTWRVGAAPTRALAAATALFLLLAPGFGVQYTVYAAPLAFAFSLRWGIGYGAVAGLYLLLVYGDWLVSTVPLESTYRTMHVGLAFAGFAVWMTLAAFLADCLRRPAPTPRETS